MLLGGTLWLSRSRRCRFLLLHPLRPHIHSRRWSILRCLLRCRLGLFSTSPRVIPRSGLDCLAWKTLVTGPRAVTPAAIVRVVSSIFSSPFSVARPIAVPPRSTTGASWPFVTLSSFSLSLFLFLQFCFVFKFLSGQFLFDFSLFRGRVDRFGAAKHRTVCYSFVFVFFHRFSARLKLKPWPLSDCNSNTSVRRASETV